MSFLAFLTKSFRAPKVKVAAGVDGKSSIEGSSEFSKIIRHEPPFRFMDLPLEIRLLVYDNLVPNAFVSEQGLVPIMARSDGQRTCSTLLHVNRQIYFEALDKWYGTAVYAGLINPVGFWILGSLCLIHKPIPPAFFYIRQLDLSIRLKVLRAHGSSKEPLGLYDPARTLEMCFPPWQESKLKKLQIRLLAGEQFITFYTGHPALLRQDLTRQLAPFGNLKGLMEVSLQARRGDFDQYTFDQEIKPIEEVMTGILEFARVLVDHLASPVVLWGDRPRRNVSLTPV